ncbi:class II aldolase/adducin family protein [Pseudomonas sp. PGPPP1]|uniref:class II aldolase/adducin family protein n=1 Tax=Pseudomonas sp. PGPPP1 TaxID=2015553 RepID=UPI00257C8BE6|nr:class II aldolase/adducin family protein [Pseudomonas sp. PGPPP1]
MPKIGDIEYPSLKGEVSEEEWSARVQLAALCRLVPAMGWDDLSNQLVSCRIGKDFLFIPAGVLFEEMTASCLLKVNMEGEIISDSPFKIVPNVWHPMRAVFEVRPDANTVIHTHDDYIAAVAATKHGLLPISQPAALVIAAGISYHTYEGAETYAERIPGMRRDLGSSNFSLLLRNHGVVTLAPTIDSAFMLHHLVRKACRIQVMSGVNSGAEVTHISADVVASFPIELLRASVGDGSNNAWPGLLRKLYREDPSFQS